MPGLPVLQDPNNPGDPNQLDTLYVSRSMGTTAQNWAGTAMAPAVQLANQVMAQLPGNPNPQDKTPGYLAVGQPEGANNAIIPSTDINADPAPVAPTTGTAASGGTVANGTYQCVVTYVFPWGESPASPATAQVTTGTNISTLTVNSPVAVPNATGWYAYISQAGGTAASATRQQAAGSPGALGVNYTTTTPPSSSGVTAAASNLSLNLQVSGTPAATLAGGGGYYPNALPGGGGSLPSQAALQPIPNPMLKSGWTVQNTAGIEPFLLFAYAPATFLHGTVQTINPTELALDIGAIGPVVVTVAEVNGVKTSTLPTGYSITASTGVIALAGTTVAGVTTIGLTVTDNQGRNAEASITVTLT